MLQNQLLQPDGGFLTRCNIADDHVLWHELSCAHSTFSALWSHLFSRDSYKIFNCMNFHLCKAAPRWCSAFIICHAWWIVLQASTESFTECTKRKTSRVLLTFSCPCWQQERHPDSEWCFFSARLAASDRESVVTFRLQLHTNVWGKLQCENRS